MGTPGRRQEPLPSQRRWRIDASISPSLALAPPHGPDPGPTRNLHANEEPACAPVGYLRLSRLCAAAPGPLGVCRALETAR